MSIKQMEPTKEVVGGLNFYIRPFPAFKAANLTGELASLLAPLLSAIAPLIGGSSGLMDIDAEVAAEAMLSCPMINGDKLEKLLNKLLLGGHIVVEVPCESGNVEAQRLTEDIANEVFCGEVQDIFILCFHVIKLNFNGFFKRLADQSGKEKLAEEKMQRTIL